MLLITKTIFTLFYFVDSPEKVTQIDATELLMREYGKRLDQFDDSCADDQILWEQIGKFKIEEKSPSTM